MVQINLFYYYLIFLIINASAYSVNITNNATQIVYFKHKPFNLTETLLKIALHCNKGYKPSPKGCIKNKLT